MPNYKVVDADQLDADLTTVADAIREKTGKEDKLTLEQMVEEIGSIQASEELYRTPYSGRLYRAIEDFTAKEGAAKSGSNNLYYGAEYLEEATIRGWNNVRGGVNSKPFGECPNLRKINLPNLTTTNSYVTHTGCDGLIEAYIGSVGYPITSLYYNSFYGAINPNLVITVYVDATTLADIPTAVSNAAPWGATNATIIYRNSTTGEVITE